MPGPLDFNAFLNQRLGTGSGINPTSPPLTPAVDTAKRRTVADLAASINAQSAQPAPIASAPASGGTSASDTLRDAALAANMVSGLGLGGLVLEAAGKSAQDRSGVDAAADTAGAGVASATAGQTPDAWVSARRGQPAPSQDRPDPVVPVYSPGSAGTLVRGGRTPQSWTTQTEVGIPVSEGALDENRQARLHAAIGQQLAADSQMAKNQIEANTAEAGRLEIERQQRDDEVRARERKSAYDSALAKVNSQTIDPARVWHNAGTGGTILGLLAIGLGEAGGALTGRGNTALQQIDAAVERDIEAQRAANQRNENALNLMRSQWGDEDSALNAMRAQRWKAIELQQQELMRDAKDKDTLARLAEGTAAAHEKASAYAERVANAAADKQTIAQHDVQTPDRVVGGSGPRMVNAAQVYADQVARRVANGETLEDARKGASADVAAQGGSKSEIARGNMAVTAAGIGPTESGGTEARKAADDMAARFVPELGGYARDATQARKLSAAAEARANLERNYNRIEELRASLLNRFSPSARGELDTLVADNTLQWKNLGELGVLSADDRELIAPLTGQGALDVTSTPRDSARLVTARQLVNDRLNAAARNAGVTPGQEVMTRTGVRGVQTGVAPLPSAVRATEAAAAEGFTPAGAGGRK